MSHVLAWLAVPPVSLAEAAWREALRREAVGQPTATYTNATLPSEPLTTLSDTPGGQSSNRTMLDSDEAAWRNRIRELKEAIVHDQQTIAETESRLGWLQSQAVSRDDPAQQAALRQQATEALESMAELKQRLADSNQALAALLEEARRRDVPPGWLR